MRFSNRSEAGKQLAIALDPYRGQDVVVLALPRGGVPVAAEVAIHLGAPLDLLLVRKIGVPWYPELAMGAVIDGSQPMVVRNEETIRFSGISEAEFDAICQRQLAEIERRRQLYFADRPCEEISGRIAIIVDDGIATGATVRAAIAGLRARKPAKIVVAVPVAPPNAVAELQKEADEVVSLLQPRMFGAIGYFYRDFEQLTDDDVTRLLSGHLL
ncbi:phosphoribosyltransferase [Ensifer sp. Root1252]|nr:MULTISPECIES: phosphoribosyltransferase [unclassified Ensifer]KQW51051.1 phosphoribosyltransferase [Ensifer sp. Root1252]KRC54301.1 phosphoribosyltransferase [Ensifer sp. Root231]KRD01635.1 phosphoribosyltransferase [Ensifer sp. Root258]